MNLGLQKSGTGLLAISLILTWASRPIEALVCLVFVGIIDLWLCYKKLPTISNWVHDLFSKKIDIAIMIGLLVYTWAIWGPVGFVPVLTGVIIGHLFTVF